MSGIEVGAQAQVIVRASIGLVFVCSAIAKLRAPAAFVRGVVEFHVLPPSLARVYGWSLPVIELGTGLLLVFGLYIRIAAFTSVLLLSSFATAMLAAVLNRRETTCHCFGDMVRSRVGFHNLVEDLVLLIPSLWLLLESNWAFVGTTSLSSVDTSLLVADYLISVFLVVLYLFFVVAFDILRRAYQSG